MPARFSLLAPLAESVSLVGCFNKWEPGKHMLLGPDADGIWNIVLPLPSGRYEYRFVLNGAEWVPDPHAPSVDDGMGSRNSLITVGP